MAKARAGDEAAVREAEREALERYLRERAEGLAELPPETRRAAAARRLDEIAALFACE